MGNSAAASGAIPDLWPKGLLERAAFAEAIADNPHEDTHRLAYADWLDEYGESPGEACDQRLAVLMRAIRATPDDDGPRRKYADVCGQYGRAERAEFIRVQVELAKTPRVLPKGTPVTGGNGPADVIGFPANEVPNRRHAELAASERQLLLATKPGEWSGFPDGFGSLVTDARGWWRFARGFVEQVACPAAEWETHGDAVCEAQPVTAVRFTDSTPGIYEYLSKPWSFWHHYGVAGRTVDLHEAMVVAAGSGEVMRRVILSARWPQIPHSGWTFPAVTTHLYLGGPDAAGPGNWSNGVPPAAGDTIQVENPPDARFAQLDEYIARVERELLRYLRTVGPREPAGDVERNLRHALERAREERRRAAESPVGEGRLRGVDGPWRESRGRRIVT